MLRTVFNNFLATVFYFIFYFKATEEINNISGIIFTLVSVWPERSPVEGNHGVNPDENGPKKWCHLKVAISGSYWHFGNFWPEVCASKPLIFCRDHLTSPGQLKTEVLFACAGMSQIFGFRLRESAVTVCVEKLSSQNPVLWRTIRDYKYNLHQVIYICMTCPPSHLPLYTVND